MFWFQLWREFKLSIAELLSVFNDAKIAYYDKQFLILNNIEKDIILSKVHKLWWTIKVVEILNYNNLNEAILDIAIKNKWKFNYWLSVFWRESNLKMNLIGIKKYLKENGLSSRFVNKDFQNLSSSQIIWEDLVLSNSDFIQITTANKTYIWNTIWVQDIESYSKRDYWKSRDMEIGMLPPKLSQIMINLSENKKWEYVFDPFVWLWTILIESAYMGIEKVFWSDYNEEMVSTSIKNLDHKWVEANIIYADARDIFKNPILLENKNLNIVTEWFLWEIMTKKNISTTRIWVQRKNLRKLYEKFFAWLKQIHFSWNIVISFPFWELEKKYLYFEEIYEILNNYCEVKPLFPTSIDLLPTKVWSLLYKRKTQLVWREIFKLKIKK